MHRKRLRPREYSSWTHKFQDASDLYRRSSFSKTSCMVHMDHSGWKHWLNQYPINEIQRLLVINWCAYTKGLDWNWKEKLQDWAGRYPVNTLNRIVECMHRDLFNRTVKCFYSGKMMWTLLHKVSALEKLAIKSVHMLFKAFLSFCLSWGLLAKLCTKWIFCHSYGYISGKAIGSFSD